MIEKVKTLFGLCRSQKHDVRRVAIKKIREFASKHALNLGKGETIKDLIKWGRR